MMELDPKKIERAAGRVIAMLDKRIAELEAEIQQLTSTGDTLVAAIRNHDLREDNIKAWEEVRRG